MEVAKLILSSAGLFALLVSLIQLIKSAVENRKIKKADKATQENTDQRDDRRTAEGWNAAYRSRAEAHLPWDATMRSKVYQLQDQVNDERERRGLEPIKWEPLDPSPPLFPPPTG